MGSIRELNINDVKLILKFQFIGNNKIRLHLVSIKNSCLFNVKKQDGWNFYNDDISKFSVWSSGTLSFDRTQLRLPDTKNIKGNISTECKFSDDKTRKDVLRKLYNTLTKWSNKMDNENIPNRVVIDDNYWYVK